MKVVACAEVQWRYVRTRKQQILSRFPEDWPILFLQPYVRGRSNPWWPRRDRNVTYVTVPVIKNVPQLGLRGLLGRRWVRFLVDAFLFLWLSVLRRLLGFGGRDVFLYVSNIYFGRILPWLPHRAALYDCNDNHLAFPDTPDWAREYFAWVVRRVDAVVVSQPLLREEIEPLRRDDVVQIGNGVDFALFDRTWSNPVLPEEIAAIPGPRIGYAGAMAEWIDFELLEQVAVAFPQASLVLVGPSVGSQGAARLAATHGHVHWLGAKPHAELPGYVAGMDVCLIPFRLTPLTRGVNPNKLYEYFSLGKPVVSTAFSPYIHEFEPLVRVGKTVDAVLAGIEDSLRSPGDSAARRAVAREHSWERSATAMADLCEQLASGNSKQL